MGVAKAIEAALCVDALIEAVGKIAVNLLPVELRGRGEDAAIGRTAVVTQAIDNDAGKGQVKLDGNVWTARSADGKAIEEGRLTVVKAIEGVKLIVEAAAETE